MKKIILHVGSGKTGSTSIQKSLFESKSKNDDNLFYPNILDHKGNQIFRFAFCDVNDTPSNIRAKFKKKPLEYAKYQDSIKKSFKENVENHDDVVVSSEFLFLSGEDEIKEIKKYLNSIGFTEIHIVMYLRDPAKYYLSVAQQALKNQTRLPSPNNFRYDMLEAIKNWQAIDPITFTVKEFDRNKLFLGDVVSDFQKYITGLGYCFEINPSGSSSKNETMSVEGTTILQDFHRMIENSSNLNDEQVKEFKIKARRFSNVAVEGTRPILKEDIRGYIYSRYYETILSLNNDYSIFSEIIADNTLSNASIEGCSYQFFSDLVLGFDMQSYLSLLRKI